jgi:uncharacterized protein (TIGR02996 family)
VTRTRGASPPSDHDQKDPLFEQVLADPDDDELRTVWADALIERGDPLGELISIQVLGRGAQLSAAQTRRARSLIAKHRVTWLGPLADIVQRREGLVFDRGLMIECQVQVKKLAALAAAVGNPRWVALRRIWFCDRFAWDPRIVPLLAHPVLRSLREVYTVGLNNVLPALARHDRPLPFTSIWTLDDDTRSPTTSIRDVIDCPGLPLLRRLGFTKQSADYILELPITRRISTLGVVNIEPAGVWLARTASLDHLTGLELRRWWIPSQGPTRQHFILSFTRGSDGQWRELTIDRGGRPTADMLEQELASIPADSLVRITAPADVHPQLRRFERAAIVAA